MTPTGYSLVLSKRHSDSLNNNNNNNRSRQNIFSNINLALKTLAVMPTTVFGHLNFAYWSRVSGITLVPRSGISLKKNCCNRDTDVERALFTFSSAGEIRVSICQKASPLL